MKRKFSVFYSLFVFSVISAVFLSSCNSNLLNETFTYTFKIVGIDGVDTSLIQKDSFFFDDPLDDVPLSRECKAGESIILDEEYFSADRSQKYIIKDENGEETELLINIEGYYLKGEKLPYDSPVDIKDNAEIEVRYSWYPLVIYDACEGVILNFTDKSGEEYQNLENVVTNFFISDSMIQAQNVKREGYTFKGWYIHQEDDKKLIETYADLKENDFMLSEYALYAEWEEGEAEIESDENEPGQDEGEQAEVAEYTVNHYLQDKHADEYILYLSTVLEGEIGELTQAAESEEIINLDEELYYTAKEFEQEIINEDGSTTINIFYDKNLIELRYESGLDDESIFVPESAWLPWDSLVQLNFTDVGTRTGYDFMGWYCEQTEETWTDVDGEFLLPSEGSECVLTAVWKKQSPLLKIEVNASQAQTNFLVGEVFNTKGLIITAYFKDGSSKIIPPSECTFTGYDATTDSSITVNYTKKDSSVEYSKSTSYAVKVWGTYPISYEFHDSITLLPEETDGSAGKMERYVLFGDWPQTIKAAGVSINENQKKSSGKFVYYAGSDGNWYVKNAGQDFGANTDSFIERTYSDGTKIGRGNNECYFKVEPIKWRVAENNLLIADNVLYANVGFYEYIKKYIYLESELQAMNLNQTAHNENGKSVNNNDWKYSTLRAFLNGTNSGFLGTAFTQDAQEKIKSSTINTEQTGTTTDKIFVLSKDEFANYGYSVNHPSCTDFALSNSYSNDNKWYLRTPYSGNDALAKNYVWLNEKDYNYKSRTRAGSTYFYGSFCLLLGPNSSSYGKRYYLCYPAGIVPAMYVENIPELF